MLDLLPFSKISWNSIALRNEWEPILQKANDLIYRAEYEMVRQRFRQANIFHMHPGNFDKEIEQITMDGMVFLPILRSRIYNGFSHKHYPVDKIDSNVFVFGVVAHDLETAKAFKAAADSSDHKGQGKFLGYPECCSKTFTDVWMNKMALDPCWETAINTEGAEIAGNVVTVEGRPQLNQMLRYFGLKITPFFPCSYQCEEAMKVAQNWEVVMGALNEEITQKVRFLLDQPMVWDLYKSVIYIKTSLFRGVVNGYDCERKVVKWNQKKQKSA